MNLFRLLSMWLPAILFAGGSVLQADTIGGPGSSCATCDGAAYTLTYSGSPISSTATTQTFQITLDVNDSSYTHPGSFLNAVAIKVAPLTDIISTGTSLVSGPSGFTQLSGIGLSDGGCDSNNSGFLCTQSSGLGVPVSGGPYDFVFDVEVKTGTLLTGLDAASIKGRYVNGDGFKVGSLLSEDITLQDASVPEPSSVMLLGSGLFGALLLFGKAYMRA